LSGTGNATIAANKTFADGDVTPATDVIAIAAHGYTAGCGVELSTTGVLPAGLSINTLYYLGVPSAGTLTLHTNVADALAGTNPVNITAAAGGGTHTINNMTVALGGSPDLSAVKGSHCRLTTTGTSHVFTMNGGVHGLATGDIIWMELSTGGTIPTGVAEGSFYWVNVLSTTTFRIYNSKALAIAGGASFNVSAAEVRTLTIRAAAQDAINLASATNTNRKSFWIRAVDNTNKQVILAATVTGLGAGSNWAIGGRQSDPTELGNLLRCGDDVLQNTDITSATSINARNHEGEAIGTIKWRGKTGARRVLAVSTTAGAFNGWAAATTVLFDNLEIQHTGASGAMFQNGSGTFIFDNVRFTDGGGAALSSNILGINCVECEWSGLTDSLAGSSNTTHIFYRTYIHDLGGTGPNGSTSSIVIIDCLIERCGGRGFGTSGLNATNSYYCMLLGSTVYRSGGPGLQNASQSSTRLIQIILDSILKDNGNVSTEANIDLTFPGGHIIERRNLVTIAGSLGGVNTIEHTLDAGDVTADPLFVDPDNGTPASRDFGLQSASPAKGASFAFLGGGGTSYRDLGAVQRQEPAGGGSGGQRVIGV
jgi:hypothetical protein